MSRAHWKALPAAEWKRRLSEVRAVALRRLVDTGLNMDGGSGTTISGLIAHLGVGEQLNPAVPSDASALRGFIDKAEAIGGPLHGISDALGEFEISTIEAGFLFGVIAGCHLQWPMIEAMPAPYAPPRGRRTKGGER